MAYEDTTIINCKFLINIDGESTHEENNFFIVN